MGIITDFVAKILPSQNDPPSRQNAPVTRPVVKKIVADALAPLCEGIDRENARRDRKIAKASEQAAAAAEDAAAAREAVERLVETARETFRDVIAELLAPHYRFLEEHLGINPRDFENVRAEPPSKPIERNTDEHAPDESQFSNRAIDADEVENAVKNKRCVSKVIQRGTRSPQSKRVALQMKNSPATSSAKSKGAKPCRKK